MTQHLVAVLGRGVVDDQTPVLFPDDLGFSRGDGCFDSARIICDEQSARVVNLAEHLDRLEHSAARLEIMMPPRQQWQELVGQALAAWQLTGEAVMKFYLTRGREWFPGQGSVGLVTISELARKQTDENGHVRALDRGLKAALLSIGRPSNAFADAPWLLGGVKTLSYVINVAAAREAKRRGADDAIFTTTDGYALEGPTSGLIVVSDGVMRTAPTGDTGILASVTVDEVMANAAADGMLTRIELVPTQELFVADGVFLVSSGRGPCPIVELDGKHLAVDEDLAERVARYGGF